MELELKLIFFEEKSQKTTEIKPQRHRVEMKNIAEEKKKLSRVVRSVFLCFHSQSYAHE
jgi:hypothetical protein